MSALTDWFSAHPDLTVAGQLTGIVLLALAAHQATRFVIHRTLPKLAEKSATQLDDSLIRRGVFRRLGYLIPLLVLYAAVPLTGGLAPLLERLLSATAAAIVIAAVGAVISAMDDLARHTDFARRVGLSSYLQVARLGIYLLGGMVVIGLIMGLFPPSTGELRLDGVPYGDYGLAELRSHMAFVAQEPFLHDLSLRENIRFGLSAASDPQSFHVMPPTALSEDSRPRVTATDPFIGSR